MGKKGQRSGVGSSSGRDTTLALTVDAEGDVNYDSILRQGRNKDKIIYSDHKSLVPKVDALREVIAGLPALCSHTAGSTIADIEKLILHVTATMSPACTDAKLRSCRHYLINYSCMHSS